MRKKKKIRIQNDGYRMIHLGVCGLYERVWREKFNL